VQAGEIALFDFDVMGLAEHYDAHAIPSGPNDFDHGSCEISVSAAFDADLIAGAKFMLPLGLAGADVEAAQLCP